VAAAAAFVCALIAPATASAIDPRYDQVREADTTIQRAHASILRQRPDTAIRLTQRAMRATRLPGSLRREGLITLCAAHVQRGASETGLAFCDAAESSGTRDWRIPMLRAVVFEARGDLDRAHAALDRAETLRPRSRIVRELRARLDGASTATAASPAANTSSVHAGRGPQ
jgi:Flp pilus assembly protein TadD